MAILRYRFCDGKIAECEVSEEFAAEYAELEHKEKLTERKETRRHQSLDKSMEHGFDVPDPRADAHAEVERRELSLQIQTALNKLTDKQRAVFLSHAVDGLPFREIGEKMSVGTQAVWEHYKAAVKKLKKFLK